MSYQPKPGDEVEKWLKSRRDDFPKDRKEWRGLNYALNDYLLHAATGTPLCHDVSIMEGR